MLLQGKVVVVDDIQRTVVESVIRRKGVKTYAGIGGTVLENVYRREDIRAVFAVFDLLVVRDNEVIGGSVAQHGVQFEGHRAGIILDDIARVFSRDGEG